MKTKVYFPNANVKLRAKPEALVSLARSIFVSPKVILAPSFALRMTLPFFFTSNEWTAGWGGRGGATVVVVAGAAVVVVGAAVVGAAFEVVVGAAVVAGTVVVAGTGVVAAGVVVALVLVVVGGA